MKPRLVEAERGAEIPWKVRHGRADQMDAPMRTCYLVVCVIAREARSSQ